MPGYDILTDNIMQAMQNSTFLESDSCQFEVRMAREKLIRDRGQSRSDI